MRIVIGRNPNDVHVYDDQGREITGSLDLVRLNIVHQGRGMPVLAQLFCEVHGVDAHAAEVQSELSVVEA